jgi:hypothetical protein
MRQSRRVQGIACRRIDSPVMTKLSKEDEAPRRSLKPKPKPKVNPGHPTTKAEHAALKRVDKMVIKRMRKR